MSGQQPGKERSLQSPPTHTSTPITSPPAVSASTATATTYQPSSSSSLPSPTNQPQDPEAVRRTLEARAAFTASLHSVGQTVSADLRARATDLHENAAAIQKQEQELARHTAELAKQNDQWDKVVDGARQGLKEIGDVQNWAEMIERDLLIVEEVLRQVEGHASHEDEEEGLEYHGDRLLEEQEEDGNLTEREDEHRKKVAQEPVDILDDVSSSASGITGTSATSGTMSESSGKNSPPDRDGVQQQVKISGDNSDNGKKNSGGWWRWWW